MAIEDLRTKQDLERFIQDQLTGLSLTSVAGLADALAARSAERFSLEGNVSPPGAEALLKGCKFVAPTNMTALAIGTLDAEQGFSIGRLWADGVNKQYEIIANVTNRATLSQTWPLILEKDDVVELRASGSGAGTIYQTHTALTILRLT